MRKKFLVLFATLAILAGLFSLASTHVAHAATDPTGICATNDGTDAYCFRQFGGNNSATAVWPRDICCDVNQQYTASYIGTVSGTGCNGTLLNGGTGVFVFIDHFGFALGAANKGLLGEDPSGNSSSQYDHFAWSGTGVLVNCGQSGLHGDPWVMCIPAIYSQIYVSDSCSYNGTWQQVHV